MSRRLRKQNEQAKTDLPGGGHVRVRVHRLENAVLAARRGCGFSIVRRARQAGRTPCEITPPSVRHAALIADCRRDAEREGEALRGSHPKFSKEAISLAGNCIINHSYATFRRQRLKRAPSVKPTASSLRFQYVMAGYKEKKTMLIMKELNLLDYHCHASIHSIRRSAGPHEVLLGCGLMWELFNRDCLINL